MREYEKNSMTPTSVYTTCVLISQCGYIILVLIYNKIACLFLATFPLQTL